VELTVIFGVGVGVLGFFVGVGVLGFFVGVGVLGFFVGVGVLGFFVGVGVLGAAFCVIVNVSDVPFPISVTSTCPVLFPPLFLLMVRVTVVPLTLVPMKEASVRLSARNVPTFPEIVIFSVPPPYPTVIEVLLAEIAAEIPAPPGLPTLS
jgi:hypothetical protein